MDGVLKALDDTKASLLSEQERIATAYRRCTEELDNAEVSIRDRARRLEKRRNRAVEEHGFPNATDDDLLEINVGGTLFAARRGTLCLLKESRFEAVFSGRWQKTLQKDREGRIFFDANPKCFRALLDCLKDLKAEQPSAGKTKPTIYDEYYRLLAQLSKMVGIQDYLPIYDMVGDSKILTTDDKIMKLRNLLGEHDDSWTLLHRSSRDGFDASSFHKNCDEKERTMTVIETDCGKILGGYARCSWSSNNHYGNRNSPDAFLFLFLKQHSHPIKMGIKDVEHGHNAIYNHHYMGPAYGDRPRYDLQVDGKTITVNFGNTFESEILDYIEVQNRYGRGERSYAIKEMEVFQICKKGSVKAAVELETDSIALADPFAPQLNKELKSRLEALKRAEEAIARLEMQYYDEVSFIERFACGETKDVVTLNLDGTRISTTRATLRVFENSVLARQFDDEVWSQQPQTNVREWKPDQVSAWAEGVYGLPPEAVNVLANHKVTGRELLSLNMEALKMMGLERPATMSLLLDEIHELGEKATDDSPFVECNPYVFGKLLDFLRMSRLQKEGLVEEPPFPSVRASDQKRFDQLIEYYFPGDAKKLATGG